MYYYITTEFDQAKHDSRLAAYGGVVLQRFEFIKVCMGMPRADLTRFRRVIVLCVSTGGSQQRFVNGQTKMLLGYPRALLVKPIKGVPGYPGSILV